MKFLVLLTTLFFTQFVFAGVVGRDTSGGTTSYKGTFPEVVCEKGIDCSKSGSKLKLKINAVKTISTFTSGDTTPSVANNTWFVSHTNALTITALDDGEAGQEVIIRSAGAITYDVTSTTLKCGTTDVITAALDVTKWVFDGTNWYCTARVKASGNMN